MHIALNDRGLSDTDVSDHQNLVEELAVLVIAYHGIILQFTVFVSVFWSSNAVHLVIYRNVQQGPPFNTH